MGSSNRAIFSVTADFGLPITLSPGQEGTLQVTFSPEEATTYAGEISFITEETLYEDVDIPLSGQGGGGGGGTGPLISVITSDGTTRSLDMVAFCSTTGTVTVQNIGDAVLNLTSVNVINDAIPCGHFSATSPTGSIPPGSSRSVTVTYTVTGDACVDAVDLLSDWNTLHLITNDPYEPDYVVELNGAGACL